MADIQVARAIDAIPAVQNSTDRGVRFPVPATNQRVQDLSRGIIQRYTGAAWVTDFESNATGMVFNVKSAPYNAVGDGVADDTVAIQAAITDASLLGGVVWLPPGNYKTTAPLVWSAGVSMRGAGMTVSVLKPVNCNAININGLTVGFGKMLMSDFGIVGTNCTTSTAIKNAGTINRTDQFYGLTIQRVGIQNYNVAVAFRSIRNLDINNCWFQGVTTGIDLTGFNLVIRLFQNYVVYNGGAGAGVNAGLVLNSFNFTGVGGVSKPEGVQITENQFYGFASSVQLLAGTFVNVLHNDVSATQYAIEFTAIEAALSIKDNYCEITGATGTLNAGIIGHGLGSMLLQPRINIESNTVIGSALTVPCNGIQINDSGNQNQNHVKVLNNIVTGMTTYDIAVYNGNDVVVRGNNCNTPSGGTFNSSIFLQGFVGPGQVIVDNNTALVSITYTNSFAQAGQYDIGINTIAGVLTGARDSWVTPAFNAGNFTSSSGSWTVASGNVTTLAYALQNKRITLSLTLGNTTVGGTPGILFIAIPGGFTANKRMIASCFLWDNGARTTGVLEVGSGGTLVQVYRTDGANFATAAGTTNVYGQITFEIQ